MSKRSPLSPCWSSPGRCCRAPWRGETSRGPSSSRLLATSSATPTGGRCPSTSMHRRSTSSRRSRWRCCCSPTPLASTCAAARRRRPAGPPPRHRLPLSVVAGAVVAGLLFDVPWGLALFLGASLAPTDAALSLQVINDERIPMRLRRALNVESGLNDGIVDPDRDRLPRGRGQPARPRQRDRVLRARHRAAGARRRRRRRHRGRRPRSGRPQPGGRGWDGSLGAVACSPRSRSPRRARRDAGHRWQRVHRRVRGRRRVRRSRRPAGDRHRTDQRAPRARRRAPRARRVVPLRGHADPDRVRPPRAASSWSTRCSASPSCGWSRSP